MKNESRNKNRLSLSTYSQEETMAVGERLARRLQGNEVVALIGPLGCGKTCFVRGMARGLDLKEDQRVKSPSYVIINVYQGKVPIYHIDLYRLNSFEELVHLGVEELIEGNGVTVIEWAEKAAGYLPDCYIEVSFQIVNEKQRQISLSISGTSNNYLLSVIPPPNLPGSHIGKYPQIR